jgi:hypothetical protein
VLFAPDQVAALARTVTEGVGLSGAQQRSARTAMAVAAAVGVAAIGAVIAIVLSARSDRNRIRGLVEWASEDSYVEYVATIL